MTLPLAGGGLGLIVAGKGTKSKFWLAITYPENMIEDWQEVCEDSLQIPFAYCVHDKDVRDSKERERKAHVHWVLVYSAPTTEKNIIDLMQVLSAPGKSCLAGGKSPRLKRCVNVGYAFDYLIHDTHTARKKGKHLYDKSERVEGNNFDIGCYEQLSEEEKHGMLLQLVRLVESEHIMTINELTVRALSDSDNFGDDFWEIIIGYNALLERYTRGQYLKRKLVEESKRAAQATTA